MNMDYHLGKQKMDKWREECYRICAPHCKQELEWIEQAGFMKYLWYAHQIKTLLDDLKVPYFIRGSSGSSSVLFHLGLTSIDPRSYGAVAERFLNPHRRSIADIDFDVPSSCRPLVLQHVRRLFPYSYRISNHVYYRERSAAREIKRRFETEKEVEKRKLVNTFRHYSRHVGGICILENAISDDQLIKPDQVKWDKRELASKNLIKLDILCNNALQFLCLLNPSFRFSAHDCTDQKIYRMLCNGDTLGVYYAESPLMIEAFRTIQPKTLLDIATCFSFIRPMNRKERIRGKIDDQSLLFDDDVIRHLAKTYDITLSEADSLRRQSKDEKCRLYGFCRAHAMHYAVVIYWTMYYKYYFPELFYSTLFGTLYKFPRMYRSWVFAMDAIRHGFSVAPISIPIKKMKEKWYCNPNKRMVPISGMQLRLYPLSIQKQLDQLDFFAGNDLSVLPEGLIACANKTHITQWCTKTLNLVNQKI